MDCFFYNCSMISYKNYVRNSNLPVFLLETPPVLFFRNKPRDSLINFSGDSFWYSLKNNSKNPFGYISKGSFWNSARDYFKTFSEDLFRKSLGNFFKYSFRILCRVFLRNSFNSYSINSFSGFRKSSQDWFSNSCRSPPEIWFRIAIGVALENSAGICSAISSGIHQENTAGDSCIIFCSVQARVSS